MRWQLALLYLTIFGFVGLELALAETPTLDPRPRLGMELELAPHYLANLTPLFDFEALERQFEGSLRHQAVIEAAEMRFQGAHGHSISDLYLKNNPRALDSLPDEVRAQLTSGLQLKSRVLESRTKLVGTDGQPLQRQPSLLTDFANRLIVPGQTAPTAPSGQSRIILPESALPSAPLDTTLFQSVNGLEVSNRSAWEELERRWLQIEDSKRIQMMKWHLLGPYEKSALMRAQNGKVSLMESLSPSDKALFDRLYWELDGSSTMEFKYKKDVHIHSKEQLLADVTRLARLAGVEKEVLDPEAARMRNLGLKRENVWGSLHLHASKEGKDLLDLAELTNIELLVRRLKLGITSDLTGSGQYLFRDQPFHRGLTKAFENKNRVVDHFETRVHYEPLQEELNRFERHLLDPETGVKELKAAIREGLTPEVLAFAGKHSWSDERANYIQMIYRSHHSKAQREALIEKAYETVRESRDTPEVARAMNLIRMLKPDQHSMTVPSRVRDLARSPDALAVLIKESPVVLMKEIQDYPRLRERVVRDIASFLGRENQPDLEIATFRFIERFQTLPEENRILASGLSKIVIRKSWPAEDEAILRVANRLGFHNLDEGLPTALALLRRSSDPRDAKRILAALRDIEVPKNWQAPQEVVRAFEDFGSKLISRDAIRLASELHSRFFPPNEKFHMGLAAHWVFGSQFSPTHLTTQRNEVISNSIPFIKRGKAEIADILSRAGADMSEVRRVLAAALTNPAERIVNRLSLAKALYRITEPGIPERALAVKEITDSLRTYNDLRRPRADVSKSRGWDRDDFKMAYDEAIRSVQTAAELKMTELPMVRELVRFKNKNIGDRNISDAVDKALAHLPSAARRASGCGPGAMAQELRSFLEHH